MSQKICVSAYNIHQGGGKVTLLAFLKEMGADNNQITCFIDERLVIDFEKYKNINFVKVKPKLRYRIFTEYNYQSMSSQFDKFYFLGNLPPIFKLKCKVVLFLQNRLIISKPYINTLSLKTILRSVLEITWFHLNLKNTDLIEVQTPSMKKALSKISPTINVQIHNYIDLDELVSFKNKFENQKLTKEKNSFIYVASMDPHKNTEKLIRAFALLDIDFSDYCLLLTLDKNNSYARLARELKVNVRYLESSDREFVLKKIYCSEYLIFPSLVESLGLPLIEAEHMGTKIIASNLDFVFDACTPVATFDPNDIKSISSTISRFIK